MATQKAMALTLRAITAPPPMRASSITIQRKVIQILTLAAKARLTPTTLALQIPVTRTATAMVVNSDTGLHMAAKLLTIGLLVGVLSACASVEQITTKDGKPLYQANCKRSTATCHKLASETCKGSYDVIDETGNFGDRYVVFSCK